MTGPSTATDPPEADTCPGCGATHDVQPKPAPPKVAAWTCAACGMSWAVSVVNPALSVIGLLPTPQLRTAALLALLRTEVTRRSGKEHTMTVPICLPATELFNRDPLASVDTVLWRCRLCDCEGTARYRPAAHTDAVEHLVAEHRASIAP